MKKAIQTLVFAAALAASSALAHGDSAEIERDYETAVKMEAECRKAFGKDEWNSYSCREPAARAILMFGGHLTCHLSKERIESCRGHPRQ